MLNLNSKVLGLAALGTLAMTGCIVHEHHARQPVVVRETVAVPAPVMGAEVVVTQPPPPVQVEVMPPSPGPVYVWVSGAWVWRGRWVWETGHWGRPPRAGAVWVPHHYERRGGAHVWISGGWR